MTIRDLLPIRHGGSVYTLRPLPRDVPRQDKCRWAVCRDGVVVGFARTQRIACCRIRAGFYDGAPATKDTTE